MLLWDTRIRRKSTPRRWHRRLVRPGLEFLEVRLAPATFTVKNTNDNGPDSPPDAILAATAALNSGGPDTISFEIPYSATGHYYYRDDGAGVSNGTVSLANLTPVPVAATSDADLADRDPDHPHSWFSIQLA